MSVAHQSAWLGAIVDPFLDGQPQRVDYLLQALDSHAAVASLLVPLDLLLGNDEFLSELLLRKPTCYASLDQRLR